MAFTRAYDVKLLRLYFGVRRRNGDVNSCARAMFRNQSTPYKREPGPAAYSSVFEELVREHLMELTGEQDDAAEPEHLASEAEGQFSDRQVVAMESLRASRAPTRKPHSSQPRGSSADSCATSERAA